MAGTLLLMLYNLNCISTLLNESKVKTIHCLQIVSRSGNLQKAIQGNKHDLETQTALSTASHRAVLNIIPLASPQLMGLLEFSYTID
jgi:hypothetical protein